MAQGAHPTGAATLLHRYLLLTVLNVNLRRACSCCVARWSWIFRPRRWRRAVWSPQRRTPRERSVGGMGGWHASGADCANQSTHPPPQKRHAQAAALELRLRRANRGGRGGRCSCAAWKRNGCFRAIRADRSVRTRELPHSAAGCPSDCDGAMRNNGGGVHTAPPAHLASESVCAPQTAPNHKSPGESGIFMFV